MLNILKESNTNSFNYSFILPTTTPPPQLQDFQLKKTINSTLLEKIMQEIKEPAKSLTTITIFTIFILTFVLILMCCCMFNPCFRTWFSTCTFMKNPKTWWTQYKQYNVQDFTKIRPSNLPFSKLREMFKPRMQENEGHVNCSFKPDTRTQLEIDEKNSMYATIKSKKPIPVPTRNDTIPSSSYISATHQHLYPQVIFSTPGTYPNQQPTQI
jgi:hypothetical protein